MTVVQCENVSKAFGRKYALDNLSLEIKENTITGLIGRNGAGKTTLLKLIVGFLRESSGQIQVFSKRPFNDLVVSANTILVDDRMEFPHVLTLGDILIEAGRFYRNWDAELANRLFDYFSLDWKQSPSKLSKGMRSTFHMIIGLASRCPLTIFDEPTTGMDEAVRKDFYRALLKDYLAHPRTIILSSHHLDEIEELVEEIVFLHDGKLKLQLPMLELKEWAVGLTGKQAIIDGFTEGKEIIYTKQVGMGGVYTVVKNEFSDAEIERAKGEGITFSAVAPSDLFVYLTNKSKGGIDDVFK